jgi:hypothetical protein
LNLLEKVFPVVVDGGLAVADEADAAFHEGADVEVVRAVGKGNVLESVGFARKFLWGFGKRK